jgi:hypothetical protein
MSKIPQRWEENFTGHDYELQANEWLSCDDSHPIQSMILYTQDVTHFSFCVQAWDKADDSGQDGVYVPIHIGSDSTYSQQLGAHVPAVRNEPPSDSTPTS